MVYRGRVKDGVVVLDDPQSLPEGTVVRVEPVAEKKDDSRDEPLGKRLLRFAGTVDGLPEDMAAQHDHHIHGTPKRDIAQK